MLWLRPLPQYRVYAAAISIRRPSRQWEGKRWCEWAPYGSLTRPTGNHRLDEEDSVHSWTGIVKRRATLEASNLTRRLAASGPDIVDEPLMSAERFGSGDSSFLNGFLDQVGVQRGLHLKRC